jgi:hypothetical protein
MQPGVRLLKHTALVGEPSGVFGAVLGGSHDSNKKEFEIWGWIAHGLVIAYVNALEFS